ncbi:MAG: DUF4139 domain-containing protein [Candidatus Brocadiia bacterium]
MRWLTRRILYVFAAGLVLAPSLGIPADALETQVVEPEIERVALFKNGLGYFLTRVPLPGDGRSEVAIGPLAPPAHGTFWVSHSQQVKLRDLVARRAEFRESAPAVSVLELLRANPDRKVRLCFSAAGDDYVEGRLLYMAEPREEPEPERRAMLSAVASRPVTGRTEAARLLVLETADGTLAVDPHAVQRVEFPDGKPALEVGLRREAVRLVGHLDEPAPGEELTVSYLAKGITWAPSYMVDISEPGRARIAAKAMIVNETADLDGVEVALVTGFPHLKFGDVLSPLAMEQSLAQFLLALREGESARERLASVVTQNVAYYREAARRAQPEYSAAEHGEAAEDLFLYPVENVHLKRGEVGYYPLFTEAVPCKHIYQWRIPDYADEGNRRRNERPEEGAQVVWHALRLENTTAVPWTTAPAQTVQQDQILGQDILGYTPPGGEATLRITQAVAVKAEQAEREVERERNAARYYGYSYDRVTVRGRLALHNFKDQAVTLEITKELSGEVTSTDPDAEIETTARRLRRMNPSHVLTWTLELAPGQKREVTYSYRVLVRR